jgi:gamma-glutamyltranspeptidase / glutathione hydrolase
MTITHQFASLAFIALVSPQVFAQGQTSRSLQPEAASGYANKTSVRSAHAMVATANPHASRAALKVLERGGSALDAAIAAQMVLTLVEPQSSGLGGGAFLLYFDARTNRVTTFDGRETAPHAATEQLFFGANGKPLGFHEAVVGGRAVGAPGLLRMLELAHLKYGRATWPSLIEPAQLLAQQGFEVSPRLHTLLSREPFLKKDPAAADYFYRADGTAHPVGTVLKNPALAQTLALVAKDGALALARGSLAQEIVAKVQNHPTNPGLLSSIDLLSYKALERPVLCTTYLTYRICGMPPPSSGAVAVAQILQLLTASQAAPLTTNGTLSAQGVHAFSQAGKLAFADRNEYIADPDFVPWPKQLLSQGYLATRAQLMLQPAAEKALPGDPKQALANAPWLADNASSFPESGTSHISIVDAKGNAVALTTTIEDAFGSRQLVGGFLLNNQLTDFSFAAQDGGRPIANRVQAGKRPRSSMSPTIVLDKNNRLVMTLGSPGGASIINYTAKVLVAHLRDGIDIQEAINLPNIGNRNGPLELEKERISNELVEQLKMRGHQPRVADMTSGLQAIVVRGKGKQRQLTGAADPRREGLVLGY